MVGLYFCFSNYVSTRGPQKGCQIIVQIIGQLTSSTTKVDLKLSLDAKNDQASIKITGPDGKWFGVGLGAKTFTMVGFFYETAFLNESKTILDPSELFWTDYVNPFGRGSKDEIHQ